MPLDDLFDDGAPATAGVADRQKTLWDRYGLLGNPFPSGSQNSGNPHKSTSADALVDSAVKAFYTDRKSHVIAVTASHGIGKTNLLNAYEVALREKLSPRGFFVIRYVSDPEPSFDPLVRSVLEHLGEEHLNLLGDTLGKMPQQDRARCIDVARTPEVRKLVEHLAGENGASEAEKVALAHQWLIGLPVRKAHREQLGMQFRLDTVESKTRALRDIIYVSAEAKVLEGVFLLLDELEKQDSSRSKTVVLQYLSALRALIDALPKYLFLMVALTTDALQRYREMLPALRGRLANEVALLPIQNSDEAIELRDFYVEYSRQEATRIAAERHWSPKGGRHEIVKEADARKLFDNLSSRSSIEGVRQREYLNSLHKIAQSVLDSAE